MTRRCYYKEKTLEEKNLVLKTSMQRRLQIGDGVELA